MKKQQYIQLFSLMLGLTFIISSIVFTLGNAYKEERKERINEETIVAEKISEVYGDFYEKESKLNEFSDELTTKISESAAFFAKMPENYDYIIDGFKKYEESVQEIEEASVYLKEKCSKKYSILDANNKCNAYYINLEKTINLFVGEVRYFNSKIKEYNEWTVVENENPLVIDKYEIKDEYDSKVYTEFVDLNKDDIYLEENKY